MPLYFPFNSAVQELRGLFKRRVKDGRLAFLGDGTGRCEVPDRRGFMYYRFEIGGTVSIARSGNATYPVYDGAEIYIAIGYNGEPEIVGANYQRFDQSGIDTRTFNQQHPQSKWVNLWRITIGLCTAVATSTTDSFLVSIKKHLTYFGNAFTYFETGEESDKIDLEPYNPAADQHRYAVVWKDAYSNVAEVTASTSQSLFMSLDISDVNEATAQRPPDAIPYKAFVLANAGGTLRQKITEIDLRQFLNTPQTWGFLNPVQYRERIHPNRQQLFTGSLVVTGSLEVLGSLVGLSDGGGDSGGSGGSFAPDDATYIVQTADGDLPNAQAMSALATGLVKNTTGTGVQSIAAKADIDTTMGSQAANRVYASPASSAGNPDFRLLTAADMPSTVNAWKRPVDLATAAALPACTYNNGSSGVGATLTANSNGSLTIDGTPVSGTQRILVKNQAAAEQNGIYTVTSAGSIFAPFVLTRATDADEIGELSGTWGVVVGSGNTNLGGIFVKDSAGVTPGTDPVVFYQAGIKPRVPLAQGGTNADLSATGGANQFLKQSSAGAAVTVGAIGTADLPTIPVAGGGTGQTSLTDHALLVGNGTGAVDTLAPGTARNVPVSDGTDFVSRPLEAADLPAQIAYFSDEKANGTQGGTSVTTTWNARDLNTEDDPDNLIAISSNQVTPIAGTYDYLIVSPFRGGATETNARLRLYNVTAAAVVEQGSNSYVAANGGGLTIVTGRFTANGTDAYRVEMYTSVGRAGDGLGDNVSAAGTVEVFTKGYVRKVA